MCMIPTTSPNKNNADQNSLSSHINCYSLLEWFDQTIITSKGTSPFLTNFSIHSDWDGSLCGCWWCDFGWACFSVFVKPAIWSLEWKRCTSDLFVKHLVRFSLQYGIIVWWTCSEWVSGKLIWGVKVCCWFEFWRFKKPNFTRNLVFQHIYSFVNCFFFWAENLLTFWSIIFWSYTFNLKDWIWSLWHSNPTIWFQALHMWSFLIVASGNIRVPRDVISENHMS